VQTGVNRKRSAAAADSDGGSDDADVVVAAGKTPTCALCVCLASGGWC
jgi:hypothetical protein